MLASQLMSRNMIDANKMIFASLDKFCSERNDRIANAGTSRWLPTTSNEKSFLLYAGLTCRLAFTPTRQLARFDLGSSSYFISVGFNSTFSDPVLSEIEPHAGIITTALYELDVRPTASTAEIRNVVEVSDFEADAEYDGHDPSLILSLYPSMRVFHCRNLTDEETWRQFFLLCLAEGSQSQSWVNDHLLGTLSAICDLRLLKIPYELLCRSIFDLDPATMFLSLYRCLEALYAYSGSSKIKSALGIQLGWEEIAVALEDEIGWHPREEGSLNALMQLIQRSDAVAFLEGLEEDIPNGADVRQLAGRKIYWLRNNLVHYRPSHKQFNRENVDWNEVSVALASMVCDIYYEVFGI